VSAAKKPAKKAVKKATRKAKPTLLAQLRKACEGVKVGVVAVENADAFIVTASNERSWFSFTVTGRDIDAAGTAIVALLKARIMKALV
jgi:hypothetical protein